MTTEVDLHEACKGTKPVLDSNICQLFEACVKSFPDAVAVIFDTVPLSYRELDQISNQIARYLLKKGVRAGALVALSLENSHYLIPAILGILKIGGVYLPLEPSYPRDRIDHMVNDAKPSFLITESKHKNLFDTFNGKSLLLDQSWDGIKALDSNSVTACIDPHQLAYIIYTSGSTGKPKGIMVEHSSLAHGALAHRQFYAEKLIGLLSGAISFDVTILIIFYLLTSGGTVFLPPSDTTNNADKLVELIVTNSINYVLCVPSLYSMILGKAAFMPSLKIVSLAGENISEHLLKLHSHFAPNAILYNEYGPTEYAIGSTLAKIYDPEKKEIYPISVGKPLPNTQVYIFDEQLESVPPGSKGEIFIGGPGLARGYLNNPQLTLEKFIIVKHEHRFERLYKTGDFGRILPSGDIEFLGRIDDQIKIRGHRIELGEVEYAIRKFPGINETVVVAQDFGITKRLVGYFSTSEKTKDTESLHDFLSKSLPQYMIPSLLIQMVEFPRTPNGKIDKKALPSLNEVRSNLELAPPKSSLEQTIHSVWVDVLKLERIGINDSFFEIGGDSLLATILQHSLSTKLGKEISLVDIFHYPTIAQQANFMTQPEIQPSLARARPQDLAKNKIKLMFREFKKRNSSKELSKNA